MEGKTLLVAYGTWSGTTREVAEAMGAVLREDGTAVDVRRAKEVKDVSPYDGVVLGTAIHAGQVHPEMVKFLKQHREPLHALPVAYFVVCMTMKEDTPENRGTVAAYLDAVREQVPEVEPVEVGLFAGAILPDGAKGQKLSLPTRMMLKLMKSHAEDQRDWDAIRAWAADLQPVLFAA